MNARNAYQADVVVVGATPGGISAAVAAARRGRSVLLLERSNHIGGLVANGLCATDIETRGATGGLFMQFTGRVKAHYVSTYGPGSQQVEDCSEGYHFEPSVAERILESFLGERPEIRTLKGRQFDAHPSNVMKEGNRVTGLWVLHRETGVREQVCGEVFIDATYEGDLAAAAGVPFRIGREDQREFDEPMAGHIYKQWIGEIDPASTGWGDNALQSFNYRLPLTRVAENSVPIAKPATYNRDEYLSLIDDVKLDRHTQKPGCKHHEWFWDGIGKVTNIAPVPNGKTDANNQHKAFLSTDLPEENWPWPSASWEWRDRYSVRLREYILGLLWFCQNEPELPEAFRNLCAEWGLARDEYQDNGHFPRQVYVREGRRMAGEYLFTAHDALPKGDGRPPVHADSITASHYALDSHAVRKREAGRVHLEGFFSMRTAPYTVPYRVIVPREVEGLLVPVAASATHVGFSTLRMEPCWMALGEAAGLAASLAVERSTPVRSVSIADLQTELLLMGAVLFYFKDLASGHPAFVAFQMLGLRGLFPDWEARPGEIVSLEDQERWSGCLGIKLSGLPADKIPTRGELVSRLWERLQEIP